MILLQLIRDEAREDVRGLFVAASLAGLSNALILALINASVSSNSLGDVRTFVMIGLSVALYVLCARYTYHRTTTLVEGALLRIKMRVIDKIDRAEFQALERLGTSEIYDRLTENIATLSDSAGPIATLMQSLCIVACASFYILWISPPAFLLLALLNIAGICLYSVKAREIGGYLATAGKTRVTFFDRMTDLLKGFKELRFSRKRSREIRADIAETSDELRSVMVTANKLFNDNHIFVQCILFVLLISVVFVLPQYVDSIDAATVSTLVACVLFFWGPLGGAVGGVPAYMRSNLALTHIKSLEAKLEGAARATNPDAPDTDPWNGGFSSIEVQDVEFEYAAGKDDDAFRIGPMNLRIDRGELLFVVGGNGSGKSTFMKVLTGLYPPTRGALRMDHAAIRPETVVAYREMFSTIFSDFHLFSRVYGLLDVDSAAVTALLRQMEIGDKTSFEGGRFTRRDLSTGQRKRLAMIIALLEDRPICVFDEWAADQDPEFRRYFYEVLLPGLKQRGKTVIAVTHDDRYFHCADRVVTLEYGQIRSIERVAAHTGAPS